MIMEYNVKKGDFSPMGAVKGKGYVNFCMECRRQTDCKIILYPRRKNDSTDQSCPKDTQSVVEIAVPEEFGKGNLRAVRIYGLEPEKYDYNFEIDGKVVLDPYAKWIAGREVWGEPVKEAKPGERLKCRVISQNFSWRGEPEIEVPRRDMVVYKLHMRGFTQGLGEDVPDRGTFRGFIRRIPYLKNLGITTVEFMPVYEFEECRYIQEKGLPDYLEWKEEEDDIIKKPKIETRSITNFWGYGPGMYFAPKASYGATNDPVAELKECVLQLHKKGMECILEMDFPDDVSRSMILKALHYWVEEYHVDGFHLQGNRIPIDLIMEDSYLGRTKFFYKSIPRHLISEQEAEFPRFFVDTDEFLYPARKLLNGMNGNIWEMADQMRKQDDKLGYVNYICDNNGFTLADLFSYDVKHNEENGECNRDGLDWNYSSNCGVEGETTNRNVLKLRDRRMRNAVAMLFLSQGVPMLMAGDEDYNSQRGNNNAYCQDNETGYKDWRQTRAAKDFKQFVKKMIEFRKNNPVLRKDSPMRLNDYLSHGFPDLSYHEEKPWMSFGRVNRKVLGIMYCGLYEEEGQDVYVGFNFSDYRRKITFPREKGERKWHLCMDTGVKPAFLPEPVEMEETFYVLEAQSICILVGK